MSHRGSNLKVNGAALKKVLVTFHSVTFRYPAVQMNLHYKGKYVGIYVVSTVNRWIYLFNEK